MSSYQLQKASAQQIDEAIALYQQAAQWLAKEGIDQWQYWLTPTVDRIDWLRSGFQNGEFYFVTHANKIVGMVRVMHEDLLYWGVMEDEALYIHSLIVSQDHKGRGIGRWILEEVTAMAKAQNIDKLRLDCVAHNTRLCDYYKAYGFEKLHTKQMEKSVNTFFEKVI